MHEGDEDGSLDGFDDEKLFGSIDGTADDLNGGMIDSFTFRKALVTTDGEVNDFSDDTIDGFLGCLDDNDESSLVCSNSESGHLNKITYTLPRLFSNGS